MGFLSSFWDLCLIRGDYLREDLPNGYPTEENVSLSSDEISLPSSLSSPLCDLMLGGSHLGPSCWEVQSAKVVPWLEASTPQHWPLLCSHIRPQMGRRGRDAPLRAKRSAVRRLCCNSCALQQEAAEALSLGTSRNSWKAVTGTSQLFSFLF